MPTRIPLVRRLRDRRMPPETEREMAAAARLRAETAALPALLPGRTPSDSEWIRNRQMLREDIGTKDPRRLLEWQVLRNTMVARAPYIGDIEVPALRAAGWLPLLSEDCVGRPEILIGTSTSANLAHHAYHLLRFQQATGLRPIDFNSVVEIGAGYGSMCRLLYRLALGRPKATLLDLPEFSAVQRYFLDLVDVDAELVQLTEGLKTQGESPRLLVATWSLSEMPMATRSSILDAVGDVDSYLFGFQDRFGETENLGYFRTLAEAKPAVDWTMEPIDHIPGSWYLFGVRR